MSDLPPLPPEGDFGSGRGTPPSPPPPPWLGPQSPVPRPASGFPGDPLPPPPPPPLPRVKKRRFGVVVTVVAIALVPIVVLGVVLLRADRGSSVGAADPQGAVTNLASAIDNQDVLSALAAIAPEESAAATSLVKAVISKGQSQGLIVDQSNPLAGVTSKVSGLQLSVHELHPLVAQVVITGGQLSYSFDPARLSGTLRNDLGPLHQESGSVSVAKAQGAVDNFNRDHGNRLSGVFIMTVKRNGRWFVSPFYTIAQYLREGAGLPAADYDATTKVALHGGASSPEDVVRNSLSVSSRDLSSDMAKSVSSLPPDTLRVVYDYMGSIKSALDKLNDGVGGIGSLAPRFDIKVTNLRLSSQPAGATATQVKIDALTATATLTASFPTEPCSAGSFGAVTSDGTVTSDGAVIQACPPAARSSRARTSTFTTSITFNLNGTCYSARTSVSTNLPSGIAPPNHTSSGCLAKVAPGLKLDRFFIMTVLERGGWYVDPLGTGAAYLRLIVQQATPTDVECFLRQSHDPDRQEKATQNACGRSTMFTHP